MATDAGAIVEGQGPAAGGGELNMLDMVEEFSKRGNQIFVSLRKGKDSPPTSCDVRAQYEETILDLKKKVEEATGVPVDKQLLFWHFKELTSEYDNKTLLDLNLHTGFSLTGYDLTEEPHYWPPLTKTKDGLMMVTKSTFPDEMPKQVITQGIVK
mmetsp:Transcript_6813/g.16669  ORF Transcript_6813/g.16669 Transcript_6813/m.16669 type:complete len:155 (-) Transcript_6813:239-703(-)